MRITQSLALLLTLLVCQAGAQTTNLAIRPVTLEECLQLALQHNLDVQIERLEPEVARFTLSASYGIYDPTFKFFARNDFASNPIQQDWKKGTLDKEYELDTDSMGSGIIGRLPTGMTYGLNGGVDYLHGNSAFPWGWYSTNETDAAWTLTLKQPLLKDAWVDADRLKIKVNKKNLKIAELALRQEIINTVTKVQVAYYELNFRREKLKVEEKALELARQLLKENRRRVEVGTLTKLDEMHTASLVATLESDVVSARQALAEQQNVLKTLIHDDFKAWAGMTLDPSEPLTAVPVSFNRAESWQKAMLQRPDLLQFRLDLEKRDLMVSYRFNQLFPSVDVFGSYGARGVRPTFDLAAGDVGDITNPAYSYGVVLSVPLGSYAERKNYKASQAARKQGALRLKKFEQDILAQVEDAGLLVESAYQRLGSTRKAREYTEAAVAAEQEKLENGESTSYFLLQFQRDLVSARSAEIRALADYNKAVAQLSFSEGTTLEQRHIQVEIK